MKRLFLVIAVMFTFVVGSATVPVESFATKAATGTIAMDVVSPGSVDINTADEIILKTLPGIGEKTAAAITAYRKANGNFASLDDLQQVKGIGAKKLEKIKPFLKKI